MESLDLTPSDDLRLVMDPLKIAHMVVPFMHLKDLLTATTVCFLIY
jgi:hypothetical protein